MIHPHTQVQFIDEIKGRGLVASRYIPKGTIIWAHDPLDHVLSPEDVAAMDPRFREILLTYSFRNRNGHFVFCWDNGRFINHSFRNNCCLTAYGVEIAIRDIAAGEELTDDYGYLNIIEPFDADPEGGSRTTVYPDDLLRYADRWDAAIQEVLPLLDRVDQPLQQYLQAGAWERLLSVAAGEETFLSVRSCYYDPQTKACRTP